MIVKEKKTGDLSVYLETKMIFASSFRTQSPKELAGAEKNFQKVLDNCYHACYTAFRLSLKLS